jgi:hypothetical protein
MDYLLNQPSAQERFLQMQSMQSAMQPAAQPAAATDSPQPFATTPGETVNGLYDYWVTDLPFPGLDPDDPRLVTRRGTTLQEGPLQSLLDIARQSDILPGTREVSKILQGYRSPAQQQVAARTNPNAADFGHSYHPLGLAIDAAWWTAQPELMRALNAAGWNQLPSESWHWSYGVSG